MERLADVISIVRRLWAGETVNYEGIMGKFPMLKLTDRHEGPPPPIIFTAIGPKSLEFAGEHCDGVLLHPFVSAQGVANSAKIVRDAAERAGRDPMRSEEHTSELQSLIRSSYDGFCLKKKKKK